MDMELSGQKCISAFCNQQQAPAVPKASGYQHLLGGMALIIDWCHVPRARYVLDRTWHGFPAVNDGPCSHSVGITRHTEMDPPAVPLSGCMDIQVYQHAMRAATSTLTRAVPDLLDFLSAAAASRPRPLMFETIGTAAEFFGHDAAIAPSLCKALQHLCLSPAIQSLVRYGTCIWTYTR